MARMVDRLWELTWIPPQLLCYRPELRNEEEGGFSYARMKAVMESLRQRIGESPIYAADSVAQYFYMTALRDRDLQILDFPVVAIPEKTAFIEFRKPDLRNMVNGSPVLKELPFWWGWQISRHEPDALMKIFRNRQTAHPDCATGLLCVLWLSPDDRALIAPLVAMGLQVASDGELLGGLRALGFEHDPERVDADIDAKFAYFNVLFLPAVMAMTFMACKSTTIRQQPADATLNKARRKRKKRPLAAYGVIECDPIKEVLRNQGLAGIQGLAAAMRTCRSHFIQDMRGQSSLIILPGGR
jgi:hypothetical protein